MAGKGDIVPSQGGALKDLLTKLKLIARLMADRRVPVWIKLLPIGAVAYVLSPLDLVPGAALPVVGAIDDVAILWLGASAFLEVCPREVVGVRWEGVKAAGRAGGRGGGGGVGVGGGGWG